MDKMAKEKMTFSIFDQTAKVIPTFTEKEVSGKPYLNYGVDNRFPNPVSGTVAPQPAKSIKYLYHPRPPKYSTSSYISNKNSCWSYFSFVNQYLSYNT